MKNDFLIEKKFSILTLIFTLLLIILAYLSSLTKYINEFRIFKDIIPYKYYNDIRYYGGILSYIILFSLLFIYIVYVVGYRKKSSNHLSVFNNNISLFILVYLFSLITSLNLKAFDLSIEQFLISHSLVIVISIILYKIITYFIVNQELTNNIFQKIFKSILLNIFIINIIIILLSNLNYSFFSNKTLQLLLMVFIITFWYLQILLIQIKKKVNIINYFISLLTIFYITLRVVIFYFNENIFLFIYLLFMSLIVILITTLQFKKSTHKENMNLLQQLFILILYILYTINIIVKPYVTLSNTNIDILNNRLFPFKVMLNGYAILYNLAMLIIVLIYFYKNNVLKMGKVD